MKNQKGFIQVLLIIGIVAALVAIGYVLYIQNKNTLTQGGTYTAPTAQTENQGQSGPTTPPIQNTKDLNSASASLDSTDTTQLDTQLNQLNSSASSF